MIPTMCLFSFRASCRYFGRPQILAGRNSAFDQVRHSGNVSSGRRDRLIFLPEEMTSTERIPWLTQERIKEFGNKIGFPVRDCKLFKQALSVNSDSIERSWNTDMRNIGADALRLVLANYFSKLRYYLEARSECVSAANRVLNSPSTFREFAQEIRLQEYLILDDNLSLNAQLGNLDCSTDASQISQLPVSVNTEQLLHNVSLSVAGAIYLDSADTADVRSIFFPFLGNVLENEKKATMAKLGINYEDTTPEGFARLMIKTHGKHQTDLVEFFRSFRRETDSSVESSSF